MLGADLREHYAADLGRLERLMTGKEPPVNRTSYNAFRAKQPNEVRCPTCEEVAPPTSFTVEHVHPIILGGTNDESNLTMMCLECNHGREHVMAKVLGSTSLASLRKRWSVIAEPVSSLLVWLLITGKRGSEGWGYFPTLDAEFRTQRNLDQLPTRVVRTDQSEELPVEPTLLGRIRFGFRTLRDALKESPRPTQEQRDKVAYSCPCGLEVGVPSTYVGWFRCPSCRSRVKRNADGSFEVESDEDGTRELKQQRRATATAYLQDLVATDSSFGEIREEFFAWAMKEFELTSRIDVRTAMGISRRFSFPSICKKLLSDEHNSTMEGKRKTKIAGHASQTEETDAAPSIQQVSQHRAVEDFFQANIPETPLWIKGSQLGIRLSDFLIEEGYEGRPVLNEALGLESNSSLEELIAHCLGDKVASRWPEKTIVEFQLQDPQHRVVSEIEDVRQTNPADEHQSEDEPSDVGGVEHDEKQSFLEGFSVNNVATVDRLEHYCLQEIIIEKFGYDESTQDQIRTYFAHVRSRIEGGDESVAEWHSIQHFSTGSRGIRFPPHPDELFDALEYVQAHKEGQTMSQLLAMMKAADVVSSKSRITRILMVLSKACNPP